MQAILRPLNKKQQTWTVTVLARTGRDKVRVRLPAPANTTFAVERFRLFRVDQRMERVTPAALDALPWEGKGLDPLQQPTAEQSGGLPLIGDLA